MTLQELVDRAIFTVQSSTKLGENPIISQDLEAEVLAARALQILATEVAADGERRHLLMKSVQVTLDGDGKGVLPAEMYSEYLDRGSVRDADLAANNGKGNVLVRVHQYETFLGPLSPFLGFYATQNNEIHTRAISSGGFSDTQGPLTVECSYVPTVAEVPVEIEDDLVMILAELLTHQRA